MAATVLKSSVRRRRADAGLSQSDLAARVGVSRQAVAAIEAGGQVPSTVLALQLARALDCGVDDLFQLAGGRVVRARVSGASAGPSSVAVDRVVGGRVVLGRVDGDLVGHSLLDPTRAADGVLLEGSPSDEGGLVELLNDLAEVDANLLVAGCAPLLGILSERLGRRFRDARATWIPADSARALELLAEGLVHVAGIHLADASDPHAHARAAQAAFPDEATTVVNLARWRQGLVVAPGNPLGLDPGPGLLRRGVRLVSREPGSGARRVIDRLLSDAEHSELTTTGLPFAKDHAEVARLIGWGLADAGVAIEAEALARGLHFIPICEERFDLIVPSARLEKKPVSRFLDLIDQASFRAEAARLPGYDLTQSGHALSLRPEVEP